MAGPTTDTLNDDVKDLHADFHRSELEIKDEFKRVAVSIAEIKTQIQLTTRVAVWGIAILAGTLITGTFSGIWWASRITTKLDIFESRFDKLEFNAEKIESRFDKLEANAEKVGSRFDQLESNAVKIESRFDKLEASVAKNLEQTRPK